MDFSIMRPNTVYLSNAESVTIASQ